MRVWRRARWRGQPCRDGFQCATVRAPLDYDNPGGAKISLSLIRLPAATRSERIGSLLINPGGPGGSGVDFVRDLAKFLPLELRARFDIVGFDPRGDHAQHPAALLRHLRPRRYAVLPPFPFPVTPAEEQVQRAADQALAAACARHGGAILAHMSTADAARDMDFLRAALGDRKLNYLGFSYGSMLGQTYANLFPDRSEPWSSTGSSTRSPGDRPRRRRPTVPIGTRLRSDVGAQKTLEEFFRLCDAGRPPTARFAGNSGRRYAALARRLRAAPLRTSPAARRSPTRACRHHPGVSVRQPLLA